MINYCLPIIESDESEIERIIENNMDSYQFFEVWLDYIESLDDLFVKKLAKKLPGKLILVFRRQNLEEIQMSLERRLALLKLLDQSGVYCDIDIESQKAEFEYIQESGININTIASYHNYKITPSTSDLWQIIDIMKMYGPTVYKIASLCKSESDALRLMELLRDIKNQELRTIILGMGEHGVMTRVFGTIMGNEMIFAPLKKETSSAPGQLTRTQLQIIYKELGY